MGLLVCFSFSRAALWIGTTSFMILVLPVVFETERLQLEQQQLQQQRQVSVRVHVCKATAEFYSHFDHVGGNNHKTTYFKEVGKQVLS